MGVFVIGDPPPNEWGVYKYQGGVPGISQHSGGDMRRIPPPKMNGVRISSSICLR